MNHISYGRLFKALYFHFLPGSNFNHCVRKQKQLDSITEWNNNKHSVSQINEELYIPWEQTLVLIFIGYKYLEQGQMFLCCLTQIIHKMKPQINLLFLLPYLSSNKKRASECRLNFSILALRIKTKTWLELN